MARYKNSCKSLFSFSHYDLKPLTYTCSELVPEITKSTQIRDAILTQDRPTVHFKNILTNTHVYSGIVTVTPSLCGAVNYSLQCFVQSERRKPVPVSEIGYRLQRKSWRLKWPRASRTSFSPVNTFNTVWQMERFTCGTSLQLSAANFLHTCTGTRRLLCIFVLKNTYMAASQACLVMFSRGRKL